MKYFGWVVRGKEQYMKGQTLMSQEQVDTLVSTMAIQPRRQEFHESVQTFDENGKALHCPLYFDFDGKNALNDCRLVVDQIEWKFGDYPRIFFSGNAGFHLIMPYPVHHPYCNLIAQEFAKDLCGDQVEGLDTQIYAARHLLRRLGSVHFKSGLYKIELKVDELYSLDMHGIRELAREPMPPIDCDYSYNITALNEAISIATKRVESIVNQPRTEGCTDNRHWQAQLRPCVKSLIEFPPPEGQRNVIITNIARFFRSVGADQDEAIGEMMQHPHWEELDREVSKVFRSIYRGNSRFGCRNNTLLQQYCDRFCEYSSEETYKWS